MNNKKIFSLLAVTLAVLLLFAFVYNNNKSFEADNVSGNLSDNLTEYHNTDYGYIVSIPSEMKLDAKNPKSVSAFFDGDMPSQGFYITATTSYSNIEKLMNSEQGYGVSWNWVVEENIQISGFPAIIAHKEYLNELEPIVDDFSSRVMFVKKDDVILKFDIVGSGKDVFNTSHFIDDVKINI